MKRLMAVMCACLLAFAAVGCAPKSEKPAAPAPQTQSQSQSQDSAPAPSQAPAAEQPAGE